MSQSQRNWAQRMAAKIAGPEVPSKISLLPTVESKLSDFKVTPYNVLEVHAALACVNAVTDTIAMLRIGVTEMGDDDVVSRLNPLRDARARILGEFWNSNMTAHNGMRYMIRQYLTQGVAYALVQRRMNGMLASITPLPSDGYVRAVDDGYAIDRNGGKIDVLDERLDLKFIPFSNMIAIRYDSSPNHKDRPTSPVTQGKRTLELAHYVQSRLIQYFESGAPSYLISVELGTDPDANARKIKNIKEAQSDMSNEGYNFGIVPGDAEITPIGNTPEQAQLAALWVGSTQAVARLFNVPPSVIGENSRSTFSNADQQASAFRRFTLQPIIDKFEQEFNLKIFGQQQNSSNRVFFDLGDFERTDIKSARDLMIKEVQIGIRTRNEARTILGLPRSDQEGADDLMAQMQDVAIGDEEEVEDEDEGQVPFNDDDDESGAQDVE